MIILSSGQIVTQGPVKEVVGQAQQNFLRVRVTPLSVEQAQRILQALPQVKKVTPTGQMGGWLGVELGNPDKGSHDEDHDKNKILDALTRAEIPILGFEAQGGRLQDVFLKLTEETIK